MVALFRLVNDMKQIIALSATAPHGHYVHATVHRGVVYVSGILGNGAGEPGATPPPVAEQADYCLSQISAILDEAGSAMNQILKLSVHVADLADWPCIDAVCQRHFGQHRPARIVAPCGGALRLGSVLEMDAIAACTSEEEML